MSQAKLETQSELFIPSILTVLRRIYHLQLWLGVLVLKHLGKVESLFLRRPKVLEDAVPGKSDYDVTLVLEEKFLFRCTQVLKLLRILTPAIQDVWLVSKKETASHFSTSHSDYGPFSFLLSGKTIPATKFKAEIFQRKYLTFLRLHLWPALFSAKKDSRQYKKLSKKLLHFQSWKKSGVVPVLSYEDIALEKTPTTSELRTLTKKILESSLSEQEKDSSFLNFKVQGTLFPFQPYELDLWEAAFDSHLAPWKNHFEAAFVSRHRPHRFINSFIIISKNAGLLSEDRSFLRALNRLHLELNRFSTGITPACTLVISPLEWEFWRAADPLADFYSRLLKWNLLHKKIQIQKIETLKLTTDFLYAEISEALVQLTSCLGRGRPNYLSDIIHGQIHLYAAAIKSGTWDLNLYSDVFYRKATEDEIDSMDLKQIWNRELKNESVEVLRKFLQSFISEHQN